MLNQGSHATMSGMPSQCILFDVGGDICSISLSSVDIHRQLVYGCTINRCHCDPKGDDDIV